MTAAVEELDDVLVEASAELDADLKWPVVVEVVAYHLAWVYAPSYDEAVKSAQGDGELYESWGKPIDSDWSARAINGWSDAHLLSDSPDTRPLGPVLRCGECGDEQYPGQIEHRLAHRGTCSEHVHSWDHKRVELRGLVEPKVVWRTICYCHQGGGDWPTWLHKRHEDDEKPYADGDWEHDNPDEGMAMLDAHLAGRLERQMFTSGGEPTRRPA